VDGVLTAAKRGDSLLVADKFHLWTNIEKISFNKHRFSIRPKSSVNNGTTDKYNFFTESYRKYVCTERQVCSHRLNCVIHT